MDKGEKRLQLWHCKIHTFVSFQAKFFEQMLCTGEKSSEISGVEVKQSVSRSILTQPSTSVANKSIIKVYFPCKERKIA